MSFHLNPVSGAGGEAAFWLFNSHVVDDLGGKEEVSTIFTSPAGSAELKQGSDFSLRLAG